MNVKLSSTFFLKTVAFLIGVAVLAVCIYWLPQAAIRDAKMRPGDYSIYPLLICAYGVCITFSVALYQAYKLLSYININNAFSELSLKSLKVIKKCAFTMIIFILFLIVYLRVFAMFTGEDAAGPIALGLIGILVTAIIAAIIDVLQKPIKNILEKM
jgi:membrane-associated protease RseP (regulator of RpoE activity)